MPYLDQVPGLNHYNNDGAQGASTRSLPMLLLQTGPSQSLADTIMAFAPGTNATVFPDANPWLPTLSSWYYQVFVRILPSTILIGSGATAAAFFAMHLLVMQRRFVGKVPQHCRTPRRLLEFAVDHMGLGQVTLFVEMITATLSGVILAVGGYCSTPNLPDTVVFFFTSLLCGWSFACSIASATVWTREYEKVAGKPHPSLMNRILSGEYRFVTLTLCLVPIVLDTIMSVAFAMNYFAPLLVEAGSVTLFLLEVLLSVHVLIGVVRFYWKARVVGIQVQDAVCNTSSVNRVLQRISHSALGLSLSMIIACIGLALTGLQSFVFSPAGFTTSFSLSYMGRALDSAFRVAMFKPAWTRAGQSVHSGKTGGPVAWNTETTGRTTPNIGR